MRITQRSFTAGEVSPAVSARADLDWYTSGLSECKNAYVRDQGGVYNREGTKFIGEVDTGTPANSDVRLISFSFSKDESYILVVTKKVIEIIYEDSFVTLTDSTNRVHVVTPFENPWDISHSGFADTLTMVDGVQLPQVLKRYAHNDWRIEPIAFGVPTAKPDTVYVHIERETSPTTDNLKAEQKREYSYAVTAVSVDDIESLATNGSAITKYLDSETAMEVRTGFAPKETIKEYNVYKSLAPKSGLYGYIGSCKNDFIDEAGHLVGQFLDYNYAPDMALSPPLDNEPFKEENDRPSACSFYQQRRIFASTKNDPQKIFCTETGDISSMRFSRPNKPTDAIIQEVVSNSINKIRHILNFGGLVLLTSDGEIKVTEGADFVLTPATFGAKVISNYGSSTVVPAKAGDTIIFSQDQGARLIGLNIDRQSLTADGNVLGNDLSIRAEHIFDGRSIKDMTYCKEPYHILWCVLDNGTMAGLTYNREHKVWGFHRHETKGKYLSAATIPNKLVSSTYIVVDRVINGVNKRYVERMVKREDKDTDTCFFVDCGVAKPNQITRNVLNLEHLNGEEVIVLADGAVIKGHKVEHGRIILDKLATHVQVGLPYVTEITTLPIDNPRQAIKGKDKNINTIWLSLYGTRDVWAGQEGKDLIQLKPRNNDDGVALKLKTGEYKLVIKRGWESDGKLKIKHSDPLPFGLLSITAEFGVE